MTRREQVVAEAVTWLRTPYHHMGRVKGGGTDCLMLLAEVYHAVGVIPRVDVPFYPPDWNLHRDAERYLQGVMRYAGEIGGPLSAATWRSSNSGAVSRMVRSSSPGRD
jgi:cell wall-associated NlpC family hydrolase